MLRAIVFDFDGLIVETETPVFRAWAETFAAHGQELSIDFWRTIVGTNTFDAIADLEGRIGGPLDRSEVRRIAGARELELAQAQPLQPGVLDLIDAGRAAGLRLGVASSSTRRWVVGHLEHRGLVPCFDCIRCRDDVGGAGKPDPAVYRAVLECLRVRPREAVAIEDSPHGIAAARAAGMPCVAVPGPLTEGLDFAGADLCVPSVADLDLRCLADVAGGRS